MAIFNEIQVGRFNRWLQKLTGIKGHPPVKQLGSELMPVIPFFHGIEDRYLYGWQRFRTAITNGPQAAVTSGIRFRNPSGSNIVAVIEQLWIIDAPADPVGYVAIARGQATGDLDTLLGGQLNQREDPRGQQAPGIIVSVNSVALVALTNATTIMTLPVSANGVYQVMQTVHEEFQCSPGDSIQFSQNNAQNQVIRLSLLWRERFLEDSERT